MCMAAAGPPAAAGPTPAQRGVVAVTRGAVRRHRRAPVETYYYHMRACGEAHKIEPNGL
eukprot:COSAG01_NODE_325_length_18790_cov_64.371101_10_plen_59_part_00